MSESWMPSRRTLLWGAALVLIIAFGMGGWYATRTPTAPPGNVPAVPNKGARVDPLPDDGVPATLSTAELETIKKGGTVERKMPGGGSITFGPPPKKEKSK